MVGRPSLIRASRWLLILLLGGIFLYAGSLKAWRPSQLAQDIFSYEILPYSAAAALAVYLPWLETLAGVGLFLPRARWGALAILQGLLVVFMLALGWAWFRGLDISCGCFGSSDEPANFPLLMGRDVGLLLAAILLTWLELTGTARDKPHHSSNHEGRAFRVRRMRRGALLE